LGAFALFEPKAAQFAPYPPTQAAEPGAALRIAKVRHPPRQKTVQFPDHPLKRYPAISARDGPNPLFDALDAPGR